jgi:S1-C subfamily serine protease
VALYYSLPNEKAVEVMSVNDKSPAQSAGLRTGDLIVAINEQPIITIDDLHRFLAQWPIGEPVPLTVIRATELLTLSARPVEAA